MPPPVLIITSLISFKIAVKNMSHHIPPLVNGNNAWSDIPRLKANVSPFAFLDFLRKSGHDCFESLSLGST
jgi:hypothetical protein